MTDFFDWLTASDSGLAAEGLAERFRLSQKEMRETTEALAPAYLLGLQRAMADPAAWTDLLRKFSALGADRAFPGFGMPPQEASRPLLESLFGTGALTHAIARQASVMTGIAPDVIEKMMPSLAVLTMQTMMRMTGAGASPDRGASASDGAGIATAEMLRRSANAVEAFSRPSGAARGAAGPAVGTDYLSALFADALRGSFPWITPEETPAARAGSRASGGTAAAEANPFLAFAPMLEAFSRGLSPASPAKAPDPGRHGAPASEGPAVRRTGPGARADPFAAAAGVARSAQADTMREMLSLFDRYGAKDA